jgi:isoleucyl-tRNA synthetase
LKLRQPLRRLVVFGADRARDHSDEIADELRVQQVRFEQGVVARVRLKPNLPVLGPRLGKKLPEIRRALENHEYELDGDNVIVDGVVLGPEDVLRERLPVNEGWVVAAEGDVSVELDTAIDDDLRLEADLYDLIRAVNVLRKESGLEITDRIRLWIPDERLLAFRDRIAEETLAVSVEHGDSLRLEKN